MSRTIDRLTRRTFVANAYLVAILFFHSALKTIYRGDVRAGVPKIQLNLPARSRLYNNPQTFP